MDENVKESVKDDFEDVIPSCYDYVYDKEARILARQIIEDAVDYHFSNIYWLYSKPEALRIDFARVRPLPLQTIRQLRVQVPGHRVGLQVCTYSTQDLDRSLEDYDNEGVVQGKVCQDLDFLIEESQLVKDQGATTLAVKAAKLGRQWAVGDSKIYSLPSDRAAAEIKIELKPSSALEMKMKYLRSLTV